MGKHYYQISSEERCEIARLQATGCTLRQIAATLDRQPSTIAREIARNQGQTGIYRPVYAQQQSQARRWTGSKLDRDQALREKILSCLAAGWSPEQVVGRLAREAGYRINSHETIYRFIYAQIIRTKDYSWRHYLPRGKSKRGRYKRKGGPSTDFIAHRRPLCERPTTVNTRQTPGHWEADLMLFRLYGQAVLTLHERSSRLLLATRLPNKAAQSVAHRMQTMLAALPAPWRQTITFDNGTEFARHYDLHALNMQTFFCDPYAPWQKGGIENAIGRMRRMLPRKTDLATLTHKRFIQLVQTYNNTPRKCLDFQTPAEVFHQHALHFKCESTPPPSRG